MPLETTKITLKRLRDKYGDILKGAKIDIKPDYSGRGMDRGYSYLGIDDTDRDFIYNSVNGLGVIINSVDGGIHFDIDNVFITEKKAIIELKSEKEYIFETLKKLVELKEKYSGKEYSNYPLDVCYNLHKEINDILDEIFESNEFKEFENPGEISRLKNDNSELKFKLFWSKRKWKYILHFIAFIPFIMGAIFVIIYKDDETISNIGKLSLLIISSLLTIFFNIFFNNHSSFKDSFKLLSKGSRDKLIKKEKEDFFKNH